MYLLGVRSGQEGNVYTSILLNFNDFQYES